MFVHPNDLKDYEDRLCSFYGTVSTIKGKFTLFDSSAGRIRVQHNMLSSMTHHPAFLQGHVKKDDEGYFIKEEYCALSKNFNVELFERVRGFM